MTGSPISETSARIIRPSELWVRIWSPEGWRCILIKIGSTAKQYFFKRNEEAEEFVLDYDGRGAWVYHATGTYQDSSSRKASNVHRLMCHWIDLDAGPSKPYPTAEDAYSALVRFVNEVELPTPLVVSSGRGFHVYWPFDRDITPEQWLPTASYLRTACELAGFHPDHSRTCDTASLLRPVGTHHWGHDGHPLVTCGPVVDSVGHGDIHDALAAYISRQATKRIDGQLHSSGAKAFGKIGDELGRNAVAIYQDQPTSGEKAARECAQLGHIRDTKGNVPEPLWYAGFCVFARCDDGAELSHNWSTGHPSYNPSETDRKLAHARADSGPTTCSRFHALNPSLCESCTYWGQITSPIQLGHLSLATPTTAEPSSAGDVSDGNPNLPELPNPFAFSGDALGFWAMIDGQRKWTPIYNRPLLVTAISRGESREGRSLTVKYWLPHDGWVTGTIDLSSVDTKSIMAKFMKIGVNIREANYGKFKWYLQTMIDHLQSSRATAIEWEQQGWKDDGSFILGSTLFYPDGTASEVTISQELAVRANKLAPKGTLEAWNIAANKLFAVGHEGQAFMLLCGFAAPLMRYLTPSGGLVVHQVSPTGKGKTMGLRAAWTIWGAQHALDLNPHDTAAARYRSAALLCNIPIIFDELRDKDPEKMKQFIISFTDGRDKNRLTPDGHLIALQHGWSTLVLSAANTSLQQTVTMDGETAHAARIFEYKSEIPPDSDIGTGTALARALEANQGNAGRKWISCLAHAGVRRFVQDHIYTLEKQFAAKIGAGTEHRFHAQLLACVKVAAELLSHWGMLEFTPQRFVDYGVQLAIENRATLVEHKSKPWEDLQRFLNSHWRSTLVVPKNPVYGDMIEPAYRPTADELSVRIEKHEREAYISRDVLRRWAAENNVVFRDWEGELCRNNVILSSMFPKNLGAGTVFEGPGQVKCWRVNLANRLMANFEVLSGSTEFARELERDSREHM